MDIYSTDEEKVEALKRWWKENGRSVIAGVVIGLGGVLGWQAWNAHKANVGGQASVQFEQLVAAVNTNQTESAEKQAELLISEFDSSTYAVFSALLDARVKLEKGDSAAARARLEWVLANTNDSALQEIARLRLARIFLSEENLEAADATLSAAKLVGFAAEVAELEGDIAVAKNDIAAAAKAYRRALDNESRNAAMVQIKLDNLPGQAGDFSG